MLALASPKTGRKRTKVAQRTILVADDDSSIRSLLKQLLSDEGYAVVEATTGTEVVEKVKDSNPDLVIMDVRMPELDGIDPRRLRPRRADRNVRPRGDRDGVLGHHGKGARSIPDSFKTD